MNPRNGVFTLLLSLFLLSAASESQAEVDVILDVRPGAILVGNSGRFKAVGPAVFSDGTTYTEQEKISGVSIFPNMRAGIGMESPDTYFDLTAGAGILVNDPFRSWFVSGDASFQFKYRKNVAVGPHVGLLYFMNPEWSGDAELEFSKSWGALVGAQMTLGYDILFVFSVDYIYTNPFDVTASGGWTTSDDELDLSGVALQFGMRGRF